MWVKALSSILSYLLMGIGLTAAAICNNNANFTTSSTYGKNRELLLASLPLNVFAKGGFFTASTGQNSDIVYALAMCRGDYPPDVCYICLNSTIYDLIANCPNQKEALSWGVGSPCMARYANRPFLGILELEPMDSGYNTARITSNITEFDEIWDGLMDRVVIKASDGTSSLKFATGEANISVLEKIYALMQCTPDLSHEDCDTCLWQTANYYVRYWHGYGGGYVQSPNCWFRWDLYPFYTSDPSTSADLPPSTPGTSLPIITSADLLAFLLKQEKLA
ncbi:hypothetical protein V6N13_062884 [Hibiscus sabdariffa]|uniref:Gnk2-homologous domain-containing protein n=2 Tax=Hibiscus sabdariffa TaxID=183260 RepID=A0ABR2NDE4_9ROSI